MTLLGAVLVVLGIAALLFGHFSYSETKPVLDAGPIHVNAQEDHTVWIPTAGGIALLAAGVIVLLAGRRKA
ncbi:MAG: hypothetical protein JSR60_02895 [Proteobacteria bacterium]|nr:hypothetical protein [Pseudomonadota bacterium]